MKIKFLTFLILLVTAAFAEKDMLDSAQSAYDQANYSKAVEHYMALLDSGYNNAELYYNLGNAYFKSDNLGKAVLNYERSLYLNPSFDAAKFNLEVANARLIDDFEDLPEFSMLPFFSLIQNSFGANFWLLLALISLLISLLIIYKRYINKNRKGFYLLIFPVLTIVFVCIHSWKIEAFERERNAIVMSNKVSVFSAPNKNGKLLFSLHEGSKVEVLQSSKNYFEIKTIDGHIGWVSAQELEIVEKIYGSGFNSK